MFLNDKEKVQKFLEAHQRFCEMLTEEAQNKLARTLTEAERQAMRDIKSFLFLEVFERTLLATQNPEEAEQWLVNLIKTSRELIERE